MERGAVTKSQKGKKACVERHMNSVPKETHAVSVMNTIASGNVGKGQRRKGRSCSPAPNSKAKTDGKVLTEDVRFHADTIFN